MSKYSAQIVEASVDFQPQPFIKPLQLSSGVITRITEARAVVRVSVDGKEVTGRGSIYLSDLWAWPDPALDHEHRDAKLRHFSRDIASNLSTLCGDEVAHPLELGLRLHHSICDALDSEIPILARAMCGSPFDAAIHDAVGQALGVSAFDFYREPVAIPSADALFRGGSVTEAINRSLIQPCSSLSAWLVVGAKDTADDVQPWIQKRGYRCFKLKLLGRDNRDDVARAVEIFRAVRELGVLKPRLSVDTNEANPDAASVLDFLAQLQCVDRDTYEALEYLEQPTGRDITTASFAWHEVNRLKPVLLDEGLTSLDLLQLAVEQGWSGLALKTCKGHSFALVAAAWAKEHNMLLAMQDLTNPGLSAIHSAIFAAHLPTLNGVELNSPQYTPAANEKWMPRLRELFQVEEGVHRLLTPHPAGLGSHL